MHKTQFYILLTLLLVISTPVAAVEVESKFDALTRMISKAVSSHPAQAHVLQTVKKIPNTKKKGFIHLTQSLFKPRMDECEKTDVLELMFLIPAGSRNLETCKQWAALLKSGLDRDKKTKLLELISLIPAESRTLEVCKIWTTAFLAPGMEDCYKNFILNVFGQISEDEIASTLPLLLPLFTQERDMLTWAHLLLAVREFPEDERAGIVSTATPLFTPRMGWFLGIKLLKTVKEIPEDERPATSSTAMSLFTPEMGEVERICIFELASLIPFKSRTPKVCKEWATILFTPGMCLYDGENILREFRGVPEDRRQNTLFMAKPHLTPKICRDRRINIVNSLSAFIGVIPSGAHRLEVCQQWAAIVCTSMNGWLDASTCEAFKEFPEDKRIGVLSLLMPLFTPKMDRFMIGDLFAIAYLIPPKFRTTKVCKEWATALLTPGVNTRSNRGFLLRKLNEVPEDERVNILSVVAPFLTPKMDEFAIASHIILASLIPVKSRTTDIFKEWSTVLFMPELNGYERLLTVRGFRSFREDYRVKVIKRLKSNPKHERL